MKKTKKIMGRPPVPAHLKAKPITKPTRVPVEIAALIKQLAEAYKNGLVTIDDIRALANQNKGA